MNFNNYTIKSQEVVQKAIDITRRNGNQAIEPATILKAIFLQGDSLVKFIFQKIGVSEEPIIRQLDKEIASLPKVSNAEPYLSRGREPSTKVWRPICSRWNHSVCAVQSAIRSVYNTQRQRRDRGWPKVSHSWTSQRKECIRANCWRPIQRPQQICHQPKRACP